MFIYFSMFSGRA